MKAAEVREKGTDELRSLDKDLAQKLWQARFDNAAGRLDDTANIQALRRTAARVKTILTERARQEAAAPPKAATAKAAAKKK